MTKQTGFTLVELVVVIVILGLLAAAALPRFINVTTDARLASLDGVAGGLRSAVALARAEYVVNGDNTATAVTMENTNVTVLAESAAGNAGFGGRPTNAASGISSAMPNPDGYVVAHDAANGITTYTPESGGSANCRVEYRQRGTPDSVTVVGDATTC